MTDAADGAVLRCRDLVKSFGDIRAVDGVGFHIDAGETYGLLGPNGAGKTTTISIVCGLLDPDAGEVEVGGRALTTRSVGAKAAIGYVPQDLAVYPDLTGRENLSFFARLHGLTGTEATDRTAQVLDVIGLADRADDRVDTYSGGMKRRLNIGVALLHRPRLLVLDEPTVGVDPQSRNAILGSIGSLSTGGMAVLYTTHYMEEAERLCDRVGIIDEGSIRAEGTHRDLVGLVGQRDRILMTATGDLERAAAACRDLPTVETADAGDGSIELLVEDARSLLPAVLQSVGDAGATVTGVEIIEPNLEAVFLHLTGKALRD